MFFIIRESQKLKIVESAAYYKIVGESIEILHMNGYNSFKEAEDDLNFLLREEATKTKIEVVTAQVGV